MASITSCDEERAEIDAVLHSGIFARAPNLESFFRYVCERHLQGDAWQLKEYSIAVEALGRAPQFDPKKDSIVRVEAHRLRKRLGEYYAGTGADHKIQILIPRGSYAPHFSMPGVREAFESELDCKLVEAVASPPASELELHSQPGTRFHAGLPTGKVAWILVIVLAVLACAFLRWRVVYRANGQSTTEIWKAVAGVVVPAEFRMLPGYKGVPFSDSQGRDWNPDAFYKGGHSVTLPAQQTIEGLPVSNFLRSARLGGFTYDIPVREGVYEIHLYFAETEYGYGNPKGGGDGSRLFSIRINGKQQTNPLDVHAEAGGPNRLFVLVAKDVSRAADGKIHLVFEGDLAFVNAIEVLPSAPGRIRPIRIVAQDHSVTDADGQVWSADEYVIGGTMVLRHEARFNDRNFALYQGERYGNFSYQIPVAPGKYRLTLHFAETWFGTPSAEINKQEHRLFDIYANGSALIRRFDVLGEAGAPNRGIEKVFEGLEPNAQGELSLQFVPITNYAEINAIEVVETE